MLQMKLLHHFNTVTAETLIFDASIWRSQVIALALQHEFLMHAVLLVGAKHLCFLSPGNSMYRSASLLHLSETLRSFRHALTQPISALNADAFMATSTLLVHYAWATHDDAVRVQDDAEAVPSPDSTLNLSMDPLFTLSQGLRMVFMNSYHFIWKNESIFAASARHRPRESLERATLGHSRASQDLEILISKAYCKQRATSGKPIIVCPKSACLDAVMRFFLDLRTGHEKAFTGLEHPDEDPEEDLELTGFLDATARLVLLLGLFRRQSLVTDTDLSIEANLAHCPGRTASVLERVATRDFPPLSDLARYIFAFPTRSTDCFIRLVQQHHPYALLVLLFFYRAVTLLLPQQQCWWSRRRAQAVPSAIESALRARGDVDLDTILQEGHRVLEGGPGGISSGENTPAVNSRRLLGVDGWDETWERTRCVLEKFGWRKGHWYSEE
ncbi:uncharacterized protein Z519_06425 [Cladophialophora bantiana CBS 173.52]|uniref:Transcription factor domain-containing protein n=1 Tax=Cladophialophora bantiana (strain ATCC 10958 / CBS 173.52 / CDC B-1940 / NIH 8579) TaxID=1442370 RepID=A0A0D2HH48_CLAB1|nr:uncharacterized protein Z519_06425 [Cladophialophora bantiana CBS 173.52]KIW92578.1 hypothetical protein Z519_06425 [Cladophialophora bantiana CBS 173.52]